MTQKRRLPEQMASHTYKRQATHTPSERTYADRESATRAGAVRKAPTVEPHRMQRVVTIPEADPSKAWNTFAQRQEQRRRARATAPHYVSVAPRTHAQTGSWSSGERAKVVRRLPTHHTSPVPVRSGRQVRRGGVLWKVLALFTGCVALLLAANFAFTNNAFRIEQVNVVGTHNDALIRSIQQMGMQGQNIFLVNVGSLTTRVESSPLVSSATLSKQWPNQITVTVIERQSALLLQASNGIYSVDGQGVVIAPVSASAAPSRVVLFDAVNAPKSTTRSGVKMQPLHPGMRLNQPDILFASEIFDRLPALAGVSAFKLHYEGAMQADSANSRVGLTGGSGSYVVESPDGWIAYLGSAQDANPLENRLLELQAILQQAQKQQFKLATIDLRYGLRPVYTVKS
jgi:POTRA domain, FtsQ-type